MTARKNHSKPRRSGASAAGDARDDSLTPLADRKTSTARRVLVAGAAARMPAMPATNNPTQRLGPAPAENDYDPDQMAEDDPEYEFKAPKFHNFLDAETDSVADEWFDTKAASPMEPGEPRGALDMDDEEEIYDQSFHETQRPSETMPTRTSVRGRDSTLGGKTSLPKRKTLGKQGVVPQPVKPQPKPRKESYTKTLTEPKEFKFQTELRAHPMNLRTHPGAKGGGVQKKTKPGKQYSKTMAQQRPALTVPRPFQFQTAFKALSKDANVVPPKSPFVPLAVKVNQFLRTSPPADKKGRQLRNVKIASPKLTTARSPRLMTKFRSKPGNVQTSEERELAELGIQFKANPVNRTALAGSNPITKRIARPQLTIPQSPALHKPRGPAPRQPSPPRIIKANPITEYDRFEPSLPHRAIRPVNYELPGDEISRRKRQELAEMRKKEEEENRRMKRFVAKPILDEYPDYSSAVETKPLTYPEPFILHSDMRGEMHQRKLQDQLEKERKEKENKTNFKAQPFRDVEPFVPSKSSRPVTEAEPFRLHSEMRAEERKDFEEELREKDRLAEELSQMQQREQEAKEQEEVRNLRKRATHKAEPIRSYAPIVIKPSAKPLTDAESPMIGEKRRRAAVGRSQLQNVSMSSN